MGGANANTNIIIKRQTNRIRGKNKTIPNIKKEPQAWQEWKKGCKCSEKREINTKQNIM